jgi:hypothetical protein
MSLNPLLDEGPNVELLVPSGVLSVYAPELYVILLRIRVKREPKPRIGELHARDVSVKRNDPNTPVVVGRVLWCIGPPRP